MKPCPERVTAVLGFIEPTKIPCGDVEGHSGPHRYWIEWTNPDGAEAAPITFEWASDHLLFCSLCGAAVPRPGRGRDGKTPPDPLAIHREWHEGRLARVSSSTTSKEDEG